MAALVILTGRAEMIEPCMTGGTERCRCKVPPYDSAIASDRRLVESACPIVLLTLLIRTLLKEKLEAGERKCQELQEQIRQLTVVNAGLRAHNEALQTGGHAGHAPHLASQDEVNTQSTLIITCSTCVHYQMFKLVPCFLSA